MVQLVHDPFEYVNVHQDNENKRKRDKNYIDSGGGNARHAERGRGRRGRGRADRNVETSQKDRVVCHKCGLWGHRRNHCPKHDDQEVVQFFDYAVNL